MGKGKSKGQEEGEGVWGQERKREEVYGVKTRGGQEGEGGVWGEDVIREQVNGVKTKG